jgi:hypothetical protein
MRYPVVDIGCVLRVGRVRLDPHSELPRGYFENADFQPKFVCTVGALSLLFWIGVVYFARMTGFTMVRGGA